VTAGCPTYSFLVCMTLTPELSPTSRDGLLREWTGFVERRGLHLRRGVAPLEWRLASEAAQATESDRDAVRRWLGERAELSAWRVDDLVDAGEAD
jgi:hypothetical protein